MEDIIAYLTEFHLVIGVTTLSLAAVGFALVQGPKKSQVAPLPPGPPGQVLIGNLLQFPRDHYSDKFYEWHKLYGELGHSTPYRSVSILSAIGDIVYAKLPRTPMVFLNSYELAQQLLSQRPNTTAGRFMTYMIYDV
jgi:hypothetical protein